MGGRGDGGRGDGQGGASGHDRGGFGCGFGGVARFARRGAAAERGRCVASPGGSLTVRVNRQRSRVDTVLCRKRETARAFLCEPHTRANNSAISLRFGSSMITVWRAGISRHTRAHQSRASVAHAGRARPRNRSARPIVRAADDTLCDVAGFGANEFYSQGREDVPVPASRDSTRRRASRLRRGRSRELRLCVRFRRG